MRQLVKILHVCFGLLPWIIVLFIDSLAIRLLALGGIIAVMAQWLILGHCFLYPLENEDGSTESEIERTLSKMLQIPYEEFKKGMIMVNFLSPSFMELSRIAKVLGV
jgi:hypothetical protein